VAGDGGKILAEASGFGVGTLNVDEPPLPTLPGVVANLGLFLAGSFKFSSSSCGITKVVFLSSWGLPPSSLFALSSSKADISSLRILSPLATSVRLDADTAASDASSAKEELLESCLCLAGSFGGSGGTFFKSAPHPKLALKDKMWSSKIRVETYYFPLCIVISSEF